MPTYFQNPENALKRATEFYDLGKIEEALDCLYDALKNKKQRIKKSVLENIINKFLELCAELRRDQTAKDGLYNFRIICQSVDLKSWEDAIRKYLHLAESKVDNAQELSRSVILDVDDLDQDVTSEILLKSVSNEGSQERKDRIVLLPWVKFLWNCYRNCLDLLRNTRTYKLYHTIAQQALRFCVKFSRKSELRKLCNIIRVHATYSQRRQNTKEEDAETQLLSLETGFTELESAISMELWQDAFKAIEDIHSITAASKKFQNSRIMAHYFEKLSCVLWKGEEYLFHAAAVLRHFLLYRDQKKNLSPIDMTKLAARVILSVLAVPFPPNNLAVDLVIETDVSVIDKKHRKLSVLLDLPQCPTRSGLVKEILRLNIIQYVPKEFIDVFQMIEFEMEPTELKLLLPSFTEFLKSWTDCNLEQYIPLIHNVAVIRLLSTLSNIYANIKLSKLLDLTAIPDLSCLEIILVHSARRHEFPITIDYRNQCVHFSSSYNIFQSRKFLDDPKFNNFSHKIDLNYLTYIHSSLAKIVSKICPERSKNKRKAVVAEIANRYFRERENYRKKLLQRKSVIEKHKEHVENLRIQKDEEVKRFAAAKLLEYEAAEKERLIRETEERNLQRLRREQEEIKRKILLEKMETFKKSGVGYDVVENLDILDLDNTDPQILFSKQIQQINKERKELCSRLRRQERSFDHLERAKRIEEIPLLIQQYEKYNITDREFWMKHEREKIEAAHKARAQDMLRKKRMLMIKPDVEAFILSVKRRHSDNYLQKITKFMKTIEKEKRKRLKERYENKEMKRKEQQKAQLQELEQKMNEKLRLKNKQGVIAKEIKTKSEWTVGIQTKKDADVYFTSSTSNRTIADETTNSRDTFKDKEFTTTCYDKCADTISSTSSSNRFFPAGGAQYFRQKYQLRSEQILRSDTFERKTTCFSEFPSELCSKTGSETTKRSFNTSHRMHTSIFERREETFLSRRISETRTTADGESYACRWTRIRTEDPVPQKSITILKRGVALSAVEDLDPVSEVFSSSKTEEEESETSHSCTPWAKLKRQDQKK